MLTACEVPLEVSTTGCPKHTACVAYWKYINNDIDYN